MVDSIHESALNIKEKKLLYSSLLSKSLRSSTSLKFHLSTPEVLSCCKIQKLYSKNEKFRLTEYWDFEKQF